MKAYHPRIDGSKESFEDKQRYEQQYGKIGASDIPPLPRDFVAQSGARKVLLTWGLAANDGITAHWRLYRDTESNLVMEIADRGTRQMTLDVTAGASPPTYNFFVSGVSLAGHEGPKLQTQGKALTEAAAPSDPVPPTSFSGTASGGGDTSYGLQRNARLTLTLTE